MLHSLRPENFLREGEKGQLNSLWCCPNCGESFVFGNGFMAVCHVRITSTNEIRQALMCLCTTRCILDFEHHSFMGERQ